jgi:hypothetical protein
MAEFRNTVNLAPHQKKALGQLRDGNILWGGVGSGKSRVALAYYMMTEEHEDVYVITTAKKRDSLDWETEALRFGIGKERDATFAGVLTVDSWNNLHKYVDVENAFFIFDEQRLVGSGKWSKSFLKIAKKNRWILLSATPGDNWLDYIPVFIANGFYRNRTEFKSEHVIQAPFVRYFKVERYVNVNRLVRQRNQILVHMPYDKQTVRHPVNVWCEFDEQLMARVSHGRWDVFADEPIREVSHLFHTMRRVANTDPSRAKNLLALMKTHPRLIVFYNFNYELDIIRSLTGTMYHQEAYPYAEWNGHKHEEIPETEQWVYAVQYAAGAEGWNCVTTNATAFWSLPYSYKLWEQSHGRTDRINTSFTDLYYYVLRSKAAIDWAIWRSLKNKKSFQTKHFDMTGEEFVEYVHLRDREDREEAA